MLTKKVSQQYIAKAKIPFIGITMEGKKIKLDSTLKIGDISSSTDRPKPNKYYPDYFFYGTFTGNSFEITDDQIGFFPHRLYVTGIPANYIDLNDFKFRHCLWSSYYEDEHGGYLFQVLPNHVIPITINYHNDEDDE